MNLMQLQPHSGLSDNAAGALAYLTVIPAIIFLIVEPFNKNSYVRFHSWQCIFLCLSAVVLENGFAFCWRLSPTMMPLAFFGLFLWPIVNLFWMAADPVHGECIPGQALQAAEMVAPWQRSRLARKLRGKSPRPAAR